jgi:hypothetical protein
MQVYVYIYIYIYIHIFIYIYIHYYHVDFLRDKFVWDCTGGSSPATREGGCVYVRRLGVRGLKGYGLGGKG